MNKVIWMVATLAGCGKKSDDLAGRVQRARDALRQPKPDLMSVRTECALDFAKIDRSQGDGKELVTICEHDLRLAQAKVSIDDAVEWAKSSGHPAPETEQCKNARQELAALDANEPAVKELRTRLESICKVSSGVVAGTPTDKPVENPVKSAEQPMGQPVEKPAPVSDAASTAVTAALPEIEKRAASPDPYRADAKCLLIIDETKTLLASSDATALELGRKADELCNYTVPIRTIQVLKDCKSQEVQAAFMKLVLHNKMADPRVAGTTSAWNKRCPANKLDVPY